MSGNKESDKMKLRSELGKKAFWFSKKKYFNRGLLDFFPNSKGRYVENLAGVIGTDYYGEKFAEAQTVVNFDGSFEDAQVRNYANNTRERVPFSLLANGYNSKALLGKLRDMELNQSATKARIESITGRNLDTPYTDEWALLSLEEPVITPDEFKKVASAEMFIQNPVIAEVSDKSPFEFDSSDTSATSFAPPKIGSLNINRLPHMTNIENFDRVVKRVADGAGIDIIASDIKKDGVEVTKRKFYSSLRTIKNFVKKSTNRRVSGLPNNYVLKYSNANTQSEQLYMVLKSVSELSVRPNIERTAELCGTASNLPSKEEFETHRNAIERASACLVASDVVRMLELSKDDAQVFSDFFTVEAIRNISTLPRDSETIMPLIADYYAESINSFAQDFNLSIADLATAKGVPANVAGQAVNLGAILYAKYIPQMTNTLGVRSGLRVKPEELDFLIFNLPKLEMESTATPPAQTKTIPALPPESELNKDKKQEQGERRPVPVAPKLLNRSENTLYGEKLATETYDNGDSKFYVNGKLCEDSVDYGLILDLVYAANNRERIEAIPQRKPDAAMQIMKDKNTGEEYCYVDGHVSTRNTLNHYNTIDEFYQVNGVYCSEAEYRLYKTFCTQFTATAGKVGESSNQFNPNGSGQPIVRDAEFEVLSGESGDSAGKVGNGSNKGQTKGGENIDGFDNLTNLINSVNESESEAVTLVTPKGSTAESESAKVPSKQGEMFGEILEHVAKARGHKEDYVRKLEGQAGAKSQDKAKTDNEVLESIYDPEKEQNLVEIAKTMERYGLGQQTVEQDKIKASVDPDLLARIEQFTSEHPRFKGYFVEPEDYNEIRLKRLSAPFNKSGPAREEEVYEPESREDANSHLGGGNADEKVAQDIARSASTRQTSLETFGMENGGYDAFADEVQSASVGAEKKAEKESKVWNENPTLPTKKVEKKPSDDKCPSSV